MEIFFLWFAGTLIILAGYLSFLWWHPRLPFLKRAEKKSGRFQVRLTMLFLLFALAPAVPLVFLVSSLYTRSMEILLVPKIERSLITGLEAVKLQLEARARLFESATQGAVLTPELLEKSNVDFCLLWKHDSVRAQLVSVVGADVAGRQRGLRFGVDRILEVWGQTGSELYEVQNNGNGDSTEVVTHCRVWLPRPSADHQAGANGKPDSLLKTAPKQITEMVVISFPVEPGLLTAKNELAEAARVYNTLALMKESLLQAKFLWSAAALLIMLLSAFSVYAARRFSQNLSRPIEALTATMAEVAGGSLTVRADIPARDEIGVLVDSFNRMIDDLRVSREKLIASERLAAWRGVARQVSHEIKNPLTTLQLALYRLRQRLPGGDDKSAAPPLHDADFQKTVGESLQSIDEELAGLRRLAEEFSEFARLPRAELTPGNLNEVVQTTARLHEASHQDRLQIRLHLDPELPPRPLDREQIKRLLNNLLKNALEAAANRRCEVRIVTRQQQGQAVLEVADNGPGLTPEAREHLFEPNFTTKREGSGLGLVMVKRIVEEHGGSIEVESKTGKGTRFRVVL
jgi:nitrogen fixation/metabolism regulation signal transduction histidine kinase